MSLQLKEADSKLQETLKQLALTLANVKALGLSLRDTGHSPDLKRVETYVSKAQETLLTTSKTLKADLAKLSDVPTSTASDARPAGQLPHWALTLIGTFCGTGIFALGATGLAAIFSLSDFLEQATLGWWLLALMLETGASFAAGYITGTLSREKPKLNATIVGGILAGFALLLFGYPTSWHTLHMLTPMLGSVIGGFSVDAPELPQPQTPPQQGQIPQTQSQMTHE